MRSIDSSTLSAAKKQIQTAATNADPHLSLWIGRPVTQLANTQFLETFNVPGVTDITDCDVAVKHSTYGKGGDAVYLAYIQNGTAKVAASNSYVAISQHCFVEDEFSATADHVAIAFDGTMPKKSSGKYEFLTEDKPWVFWTSSGSLYAQKLGTADTITLASANCTWADATRATWSEVSAFDFGLCCFFIASGAVYYRQLIGGVWYDAEAIPASALPTVDSGVTWAQVSCSRTWDWRTVLQLKASDGKMYELFTQFQGIGSKSAEHLEIKSVTAAGGMTKVYYHDTSEDEHIEMSVSAGAPYGGLYSTAVPTIKSAYNVDNGSGDYGKQAVFVFDVHLTATEVAAQYAAFTIVDANNIAYTASTATLGDDGKTVALTFTDFNNASGVCQAKYTAGTVTTMAGTAMQTVTKSFTPTGLVPTAIPAPEVESITNVGSDGTTIAVVFTQPLTGTVTGNQNNFTITMPVYDYVPGGTLSNATRAVTATATGADSKTLLLTFAAGNQNNIQNAAGNITVAYAGGTLQGEGGAVAAFTQTFTPNGLTPKPNQNDAEHIELCVSAVGTLTQINYTSTAPQDMGHIEIASITATGTLTNVSDI